MFHKKVFTILFLLNLLNYVDRQVLYAVFPLIQKDMQINDMQLGTLASVFMLVYMCYAPFVGYFADRTPRQKWIGVSAVIWSIATLFCSQAKSFFSLLVSRGFIGIGEAGFTTIAQPFLAEHYPKNKRATLLAVFGLALPLGSALGYLLGGFAGQYWGWKNAFLLAGIPGILLGIWAYLGLKDPRKTESVKTKWPRLSDYAGLLHNKAFVFICLAQAMITFIIGGLSAWMPTYMHRYLHMSVAHAGTWFGILVILGGALGTFTGGKIADYLLNFTPKAYFKLIAFSLLAFIIPAWAGLLCSVKELALFSFGLAITCLFLPTGPIAAALVGVTDEKIRSMAFAINIFIIHALGDALSPMLLGNVSDLFNLRFAVLCCTFMAFPALFFVNLAARHYRAN